MLEDYMSFSRLLFSLSFGIGVFAVFRLIREPKTNVVRLSILFLTSIALMLCSALVVLEIAEIRKMEFAGIPVNPKFLKEGEVYRNIAYYQDENLKLLILADENGSIQLVNAPLDTEVSRLYTVSRRNGLNTLVPRKTREDGPRPPRLHKPPSEQEKNFFVALHPS